MYRAWKVEEVEAEVEEGEGEVYLGECKEEYRHPQCQEWEEEATEEEERLTKQS